MPDFSLQIVKRVTALVLLGLAAPQAASAAAFCVDVTGLPTECIYDDAVECAARAVQLNGVCTANPDELTFRQGTGRFCVVGQQHEAECIYADRNSCMSAASSLGGACIENYGNDVPPDPSANKPPKKTDVQPNPFASEPNKAY